MPVHDIVKKIAYKIVSGFERQACLVKSFYSFRMISL